MDWEKIISKIFFYFILFFFVCLLPEWVAKGCDLHDLYINTLMAISVGSAFASAIVMILTAGSLLFGIVRYLFKFMERR